jgi:hypothetical protein
MSFRSKTRKVVSCAESLVCKLAGFRGRFNAR